MLARTRNIILLKPNNKILITPQTTGDDLITNGQFETNESGWSTYQCSLTGETDNPYKGNRSVRATLQANKPFGSMSTSNYSEMGNKWMIATGGFKTGTLATGTQLRLNDTDSVPHIACVYWEKRINIGKDLSRVLLRFSGTSKATDMEYGFTDDITMFELDFKTCLKQISQPKVKINQSDVLMPVGLISRLDSLTDPQNFLIIFMRNSRLIVDRCVTGVYTNLSNIALAPVVGAELRTEFATNALNVFYNGSKVVDALDTSNAAIDDNTITAAFNTHTDNVLER